MKKKIMVAMVVFMFFGVGFIYGRGSAEEALERKLDVFLETLSLVKNHYVVKKLDDTKLVYGSIRGMLDSLDDPYTRFMEPKAYKEMAIRLSGEYSGIGIYIGMRDKQLTVISPIEGTPGYSAGLKSKDKIIKIDGKSTKDMALDEAVSHIRGRRGSKVTLTIVRGKNKEKDIAIKRDKIAIKAVSSKIIAPEIGYIKLNTFENRSAAEEMKKALNEIRYNGAKGLILDVRGNGGGLLDNAIEIGSMFIPSGAIVQTVDREGMREVKYSTGQILWAGPMVLLINEASASASEILAGALRDNNIATLVGERSFGKASVQSVRKLEDNSALLLTIAKYLTPNGEDISKHGISPEVEVKISTEEAEAIFINQEKDNDHQLDKALALVKGMLNGR
ncbi:hypothetical protein A2276_01225 [candidate division WOR-1 bacterium RIFOXYA12_FULL_43_27]|uniref:PDZ domain-containing protein n=1 Tax=candidate division WOR-1 bacterium RIFOXYC2_FULL_46_14 TaxID=1802587 RepID=A0A1F4U4W5_UNCSA|nr:MAG: hypothetical protein A2276_01225 [candidate division WOR-1 bacterium RIFOXYA12_FULL_43_27]OGC20693.1 MAG: hypothetical protein A2292_06650 [candidate division WOR-1 bacterium RIFOXYB2_FULL_46_45]OGC31570.1 MAG: hypothetical protein A2232_04800 [candidate division WOR-1 bacterium RIFOXYA2_FULL_46_56]OGC39976.1 MAG: hypothetical protein A2438_05645 [candidate division WOR-1 bacterium RIFOXYC2_FULL_46_14]